MTGIPFVGHWLSTNSELLSGLAGLVTVLTVAVRLLINDQYGLGALARRLMGKPAKEAQATPSPPVEASSGPGSIAVMAFDSLSKDPEDAYIADGIACDVIAALSHSGHLRVIPRTETFALRGKALSMADIARQLHARYVVQGSVRREGTKLRIIAELSDATTGRQVWSKTYDRDLTEVLKVQEEIAASVAGSLGGATYRAEIIHAQPTTRNVDAWSLTQKARHDYMLATDPAAKQHAVAQVRKALELDPAYALASALLAHLLMDLVANGQASDVAGTEAQARTAIEHAMQLGADAPDILFYAGNVWLELGERERSESALRHGIQLCPHDLMQLGFLARTLALGTAENATEAVSVADRILGLAPDHPLAWTWGMFKGLACLNLERYEEARGLLRKAAHAAPKFVRALMLLTSACGAVDDREEALQVYARVQQINPKVTGERFAAYLRRATGRADTTERLTRGLRKAGLLDAPGAPAQPAAQA